MNKKQLVALVDEMVADTAKKNGKMEHDAGRPLRLTGASLSDFDWSAVSHDDSIPLERNREDRGHWMYHHQRIEHTDVLPLVQKTIGLHKEKNNTAPLCIGIAMKEPKTREFLHLFFADGKFVYHSGWKQQADWFVRRLFG